METEQRHRGRRGWRILGWVLLALFAAATVLPLVWPLGRTPEGVDPTELAGPASRFVDIDGVWYHYERAGEEECTVIFLHGFGASTFSWRDTLADASARCTAIAFDRPGFGLTERPLGEDIGDPNPYSQTTQAEHVIELMDALGIEKAVLVGHSAGGTVAVLTAARHPERIIGLVLEAPAVLTGGGTPRLIRPILATPQARRVGPAFVRRVFDGPRGERFLRSAWADPDALTDEIIAGYRVPLEVRDWDRALWELTIAPRPDDPAELLDLVTVPTLVVAGTEDTIVPYADSVRVAEILGARFAPFEETGHIPHEERPDRFVNELYRFLDDLDDSGVL